MQHNENLYRSRYDYYYSSPSVPSVSNALNYFENQNVSLFGDPVLATELTENFDNHLYESLRRNVNDNSTTTSASDADYANRNQNLTQLPPLSAGNRTNLNSIKNNNNSNSIKNSLYNGDVRYKPNSAHSSSLTSDTLDNNNYDNIQSSIFRTSSASSTNYKLNRIHKKPGKRKNFDLDLLTQNDWINSSDDLEIFENQYHNYGSKRNSVGSSTFSQMPPPLRPSFSFEDQRLSISHHTPKPKTVRPLTTSSISNVNAFTVLPYDTSSTSHEKTTSEESEHSEVDVNANRVVATPPIIKDKITTGSEYRIDLPRSHKNTAFTIINEFEPKPMTPEPTSGRVSPFLGRGFKATSPRSSSPTSLFGNDEQSRPIDELSRILQKLEQKRISESQASLNFISRNDKFIEPPPTRIVKTRSLSQIRTTSFEKMPDFLFETDGRSDYLATTAAKSQSTRSLHSRSAHQKTIGAKMSTNPRHSQQGVLGVMDSDGFSLASSDQYGQLRRSSVVSSMENLTQFRRKSIFSSAPKKSPTEIKANYYQPPPNKLRGTLSKQMSLGAKLGKGVLKASSLSPIIGTPNRSDLDEANRTGDEKADEGENNAGAQTNRNSLASAQRLLSFKKNTSKIHPSPTSAQAPTTDKSAAGTFKKSSMKTTVSSSIAKTLSRGAKNVDGTAAAKPSTAPKKKPFGAPVRATSRIAAARKAASGKVEKSPKKKRDFSEIRGTQGLFSQESLDDDDAIRNYNMGIAMGMGTMGKKIAAKGKKDVASKKSTPVSKKKTPAGNTSASNNKRDSSLNRKPPLPPNDRAMKKKSGSSNSIVNGAKHQEALKEAVKKKEDLQRMPSRTKLGSALSLIGSSSALNNLGKKLDKKSSFKNPSGGANNDTTSAKSANDPSNKSESGTHDRDSVESDNEKMIPLTKSNIISMTTAAITAQPVQISTTLTNQISQPKMGTASSMAAPTTNPDGTENTATSTTDIPKSDVPASLILEKSQKTLENIQKTVEDATNDIQKTINANLTDLKSMESNLSNLRDPKMEKTKSKDKLVMESEKKSAGAAKGADDKSKSEMSSDRTMRSSRETLKSLTKSAHLISKFRGSDSQRASRTNLVNDNNNTISATDNNLLKQQKEKEMLMKQGDAGGGGAGAMDEEQIKKLKHNKSDNKLLVEKMSERAISVPPEAELESGNMMNNNNRIDQLSTDSSTRNLNQSSFDKLDENPGCSKCCKMSACCMPCWGKICMPCRKSKHLSNCCRRKPIDRMEMQHEKPSLWSRMNCCKGASCSSCCRRKDTSQSTQNVMQSSQSVSDVMGDKGEGKCAACFSKCFSCCRPKKEQRPPVRDRMMRDDMETVKCCFCFKCKRKKKEPKRIAMAGRNESIVSDSAPKANCCKRFWNKLICCKKKEDPESRRTSLMSKKQSLAPTIQPPEDTRPKLDLTLVEHGSLMKGAIPVLPVCLAWFCLVLNLMAPGLGTIFSGFFCLCLGIPRFSQHDGAKARIGSFVINCIVGVSQTFTIMFCLVGWGWAIWWGAIMLRVAKKYKKLKELEALEQGEDQTTVSNRTGASNANPPAVVSQNHHRDVEAGRS